MMSVHKYRPDLIVRILDCSPTSLGLVQGSDPANDRLARSDDAILAEWSDLALDAQWLGHRVTEFPLIAPTLTVLTGQV